MATAQQDLSSGNYGAVIPITAASMANPKRDATNGVLTALLRLVGLSDQNGNQIGVAGNPLFISGSGGGSTSPYQATPKGYQQITALSGAQSLTVPAGATFAVISAEGANVRWRDDGTAPTASVGMLIYYGQPAVTFSGDLSVLQFIQTATGGILNVSYYA